jgi:hypothetical protein
MVDHESVAVRAVIASEIKTQQAVRLFLQRSKFRRLRASLVRIVMASAGDASAPHLISLFGSHPLPLRGLSKCPLILRSLPQPV